MNYYETKYRLNGELKRNLLDLTSQTNFKQFVGLSGKRTDLYVASTMGEQIFETKETKYLRSIINPRFNLTTVVFLKLMPGDSTGVHIDESPHRVTSLAWLLSPKADSFAPIIYYKEDSSHINEIKYYNDYGILLNNKTSHSVNNNEHTRISVQLSFTNRIEELAMADLNNELFVK
jgi:hypothetical protein